jgi:hypothetical protein
MSFKNNFARPASMTQHQRGPLWPLSCWKIAATKGFAPSLAAR